jgi:hypothetical protein
MDFFFKVITFQVFFIKKVILILILDIITKKPLIKIKVIQMLSIYITFYRIENRSCNNF